MATSRSIWSRAAATTSKMAARSKILSDCSAEAIAQRGRLAPARRKWPGGVRITDARSVTTCQPLPSQRVIINTMLGGTVGIRQTT